MTPNHLIIYDLPFTIYHLRFITSGIRMFRRPRSPGPLH